MAMGLDKNRARASLRFSLLKTVTDADVDTVLRIVPQPSNNCARFRPSPPVRSARKEKS